MLLCYKKNVSKCYYVIKKNVSKCYYVLKKIKCYYSRIFLSWHFKLMSLIILHFE